MMMQSVRLWILVLAGIPFASPVVASDTRPAGAALKAGEFTAELNGVKQWYKVSGTGPVCLMPSPPWGCSSDLYFRTLKPMEKLLTIVYLDSRGCGRSGQAKAPTDYRWDDLVGDLDALRSHLGQDKVWLMGHSEGGVSVLHYACRHPERVSGLVLLDTFAAVDEKAGADIQTRLARRKGQPWYDDARKAQREMARTDQELATKLKRMMPLYLADPRTAERYQKDFAATSFSAAAFQGRIASKRMPFDLTGQLGRVHAPALIVVGSDDAFCSPAAATRIHLGLPNSKLLLIEQAGHFPWLEQPEVFQAWVPPFLRALGLPARAVE